MNELAIDTKDLAKTYACIHAVSGINLTVPRGSIYGFLGRNGAGKTSIATLGLREIFLRLIRKEQ